MSGASGRSSSSVLVGVLERAWEAIRARHPEVPEVVMVVAAGSDGRAKEGVKLGHFAASRWQLASGQRAEVLVGGEGLRHGPADVLGTLLHEAAHGLAQVRGLKDTSRGRRYHNRRYKTLAEELGLEVVQVAPIGWSGTSVPTITAAGYVDVLEQLAEALVMWRVAEQPDEGGRKSRNLLACECGCGRRIRVARRTLDEAPIVCGRCDEPFEPDDADGTEVDT